MTRLSPHFLDYGSSYGPGQRMEETLERRRQATSDQLALHEVSGRICPRCHGAKTDWDSQGLKRCTRCGNRGVVTD